VGYALIEDGDGRYLRSLYDEENAKSRGGNPHRRPSPRADWQANAVCPPFVAGETWSCTLPDEHTIECREYGETGRTLSTTTYSLERAVRELVVGPDVCALHRGSGISCLHDDRFVFVETKAEVLDFEWANLDSRMTCIVDERTRLKCNENVFDPEARVHSEPYPYGDRGSPMASASASSTSMDRAP